VENRGFAHFFRILLGVMDRMIAQVKGGRAPLLPATDASQGHQTPSQPAPWTGYLRELLHRSRRPD